MIYILLTVSFSVAVSVMLKLCGGKKYDLEQLIAFNYLAAGTLTVILLRPDFAATVNFRAVWWLFMFLGILLPAVFLIMGHAVSAVGIIKTEAAQRLALFLPLVAAFTLFDEAATAMKICAGVLALGAILLLINSQEKNTGAAGSAKKILLFLGVFCGFGIIDILFKQLATLKTPFTFTLTLTFTVSALLMFAVLLLGRRKIKLNNILPGLLLGICNFANIYFYLRAHQTYTANPALIFTAVNMGVIVLGTVIGRIIFNEALTPKNWLGLGFALSSVLLLFYAR